MSNRIYKTVLILALTSCVLAVASTRMANWDDALSQLDLLVDVRHKIVSQYVEKPDEKRMIEAAVHGMIDSLDDPYTTYISPEEMQDFEKDVQGEFSGIGAEVDRYHDRVRIVTPLDGSPAWKAGVMAGDLILEVNGEDTEKMSLREAVNKLTGKEGTEVTIKVRHLSGEEETITVTRGHITTQTVKSLRRDADRQMDFMLDHDHHIGYIRVSQFTDTTLKELVGAIAQLKTHGVQGLILDLRYNPGGLLTAAVGVSDMFLPSGQRIVSIKGRVVPERVFSAGHEPILPVDMPLVVVANEVSASASEIVTGALKDNKRATFIGTRTFGKGSVQQVHMLENDQGALKITNAYYYLPSGRNIHRRPDHETWGVDPDDGFYVTMTPEQQRKMLEIRRNYDAHEFNGKEPPVTPQWLEKDMADLQLAAALRAILGKVETGEWPTVGKSDATELARMRTVRNLIRQRDLLQQRLDEIQSELSKSDHDEVSELEKEPLAISIPQDAFEVTEDGLKLTDIGEAVLRSAVAGEHDSVILRFEGLEHKLHELEPAAP